MSTPESKIRQTRQSTPDGHVDGSRANPAVTQAIIAGEEKYTNIRVPILAIYAVPQDYGPYVSENPTVRDAIDAVETAEHEAHAKAFEKGVPSAHVIRLPHANHYMFMSNETDVLREMRAFLKFTLVRYRFVYTSEGQDLISLVLGMRLFRGAVA